MAKTVALIFGGPSEEHEVSLVSAKNIYLALKKTDYSILPIGITFEHSFRLLSGSDLEKTSFEKPIKVDELGSEINLCRRSGNVAAVNAQTGEVIAAKIDVAFPICHGPFGEDGKLQGFFEILGLNYVGSDPRACAISLDKALTKATMKQVDIPQVPYLVCEDGKLTYAEACQTLQPPLFVKPANMGSSIGISKVKDESQWNEAMKLARASDKKIIIEQGITAQEVEISVLEKDGKILVSGTGEIKPRHDFYSYEAKYLDPNGAEFVYPANISAAASEQVKELAARAFKALGCRDYARADFFVDSQGKVYFNEINTHPGFTSISQFPKLWELTGLDYTQLITDLLARAESR